MSDRLQLFRTFVRVVEAGSFSSVAREANTSQPTVSRQIAVLEEHLGCLLFQRTTRTLTLTDDGRVFYESALRALEATDEAEGAVGRRKAKPTGRLRLAAAGVFGRLHVIPRLPRFLARYPDVEIDLMIADRFVDLVEDGIDLAIRIGPITDANLIARRIGLSRRAVVASPAYLDRREAPQRPEDLQDHDCIVYTRLASGASWRFETPQGPVSIAIRGRFRVDNTEGVRAAALQGLGIGYVPLWHFVEGELESGRLLPLLASYAAPDQPISAVYPSRRFLAPKVRAMIDHLADEFALDPALSAAPL
jgi:DNA-binding transcriptional LysR family regulator